MKKQTKEEALATIEAKLQEIETSRAKIRQLEEEFKETELRRVAKVQRELAGKERKAVAKVEKLLAKVKELQRKREPFGVYVEPKEQTFFDKAKDGVSLLREATKENFDKIKLQTLSDFEEFSRASQSNRKAWGQIAQRAVDLWDKVKETRKALKV